MINVLFAIPELDRGGPDRVLFEILHGLDRSRFAPHLLVSASTGHYLSRLPSDVSVEVLRERGSLSRYPVDQAVRAVRRLRPDVVFATQRMILTFGLASLAMPRNVRLVLRQANDLTADWSHLVKKSMVKHRLARRLTVAALRRADAVVCQSHAMRRDLEQWLGVANHLYVISNPIDVEAAAAARPAAVRGSPAIVSVGRLAPQKGFDLLLRALARGLSRAPGAHLTIYGDGPDRAALEALARELGILDAVTFGGFTRDPLGVARGADLFALASRYEGFPNAALEALACGTPVVLTDCPGANAEIVEPGVNGRLARSTDPFDIADALDVAIGELRKYDRQRIQSSCRERFASERIVPQYEHVIEQVLG